MGKSKETIQAENSEILYLHEFRYFKRGKLIKTLIGFILICWGVISFYSFSWLIVIIFFLGGFSLLYFGLKEFLDNESKLKLAREGIWTKQWGFKPWDSIDEINIYEEWETRGFSYHLEMYLKGNFTKDSFQKLLISDLNGYDKIVPLIEELRKEADLIKKTNEQ